MRGRHESAKTASWSSIQVLMLISTVSVLSVVKSFYHRDTEDTELPGIGKTRVTQKLLVRETGQKRDQVSLLVQRDMERRQRLASVGGIVVNDIGQREHVAIVHVRRGHADIAQSRNSKLLAVKNIAVGGRREIGSAVAAGAAEALGEEETPAAPGGIAQRVRFAVQDQPIVRRARGDQRPLE